MFTLTKNLQLYIQTLNGGMRGNVGYCFHLVAYVWTSLQHLGIEGMESKSSCCELPQQAQAKCCVKMEVCVYAPLNKCLGTQQGKSSPPPLTKKKKKSWHQTAQRHSQPPEPPGTWLSASGVRGTKKTALLSLGCRNEAELLLQSWALCVCEQNFQ